jgi:DNA-binding PadR family transcriptional regulator
MLGFLHRGAQTGYELKHLMGRSVGFFFGASYGSIYPALRDLEREGSVRVSEVVQSRRPNKKVYEITDAGRERFREALGEQPASDAFRSEFLMHLFFGHLHESERLLELVRERREEQLAAIETLEGVGEEFKGVATPYQLMTLRSGLVHARAEVTFLDEIEPEIRALAAESEGADVGA